MKRACYALLLVTLSLVGCGVFESTTGALPTAQPTRKPTDSPPQESTATGPIIGEGVTTPGTPGPALTTIPIHTPTPLHSPKVITLQDQQQTIYMRVGETFILQLGDAHTWSMRIDNERIIAQQRLAPVPPESQGLFTALEIGTTMMEANGTPLCAKADPPCMQPDILFQLTIVVQ